MQNSTISPTYKMPSSRNTYGRLKLYRPADLKALPPRNYLIDGLLAEGELSVLWAAPKSGKTFIALRLAYGLACGVGMWGRAVSPGAKVLLVAAEGQGGLKKRVDALAEELGEADGTFLVLPQAPNINSPDNELDTLIQIVRDHGISLVIIDTLARTFGDADENSAKDMGIFVKNIDQIRHQTKAHVLVIHHSTKEGQTARGSSALEGAADIILKVTKPTKDQSYKMGVVAAKDDADGQEFFFDLSTVTVNGGDETTCIAIEVGSHGALSFSKDCPASKALNVLAELIGNTDANNLANSPSADLSQGVSVTAWKNACHGQLSESERADSHHKAFTRAKDKLVSEGKIEIRDDSVLIKYHDNHS
jgi:plastocyanin